MNGLNIGIRMARRSFFDRAAVKNAMSKKKLRVLSKFGAYVRTRSRSSMRKARQKSLGEMTQAETINFESAKRFAEKEGRGWKPKRPMAASRPGEPPRVVSGELKKFLFFAYDAQSESVVIGPAKLNGHTDAPSTLEEGGQVRMRNGRSATVAARPYMKPAFDAELPRAPRLWAGALDGN